jgi:apolipoprotein N-acyltransferase
MNISNAVVFDGLFGMWFVMLMVISVNVIAPSFVRKNHKHADVMGVSLFAANTIFLSFYREMPVVEALLRSVVVALIYMLSAYLFAHFVYQKRSFRDLFRRF